MKSVVRAFLSFLFFAISCVEARKGSNGKSKGVSLPCLLVSWYISMKHLCKENVTTEYNLWRGSSYTLSLSHNNAFVSFLFYVQKSSSNDIEVLYAPFGNEVVGEIVQVFADTFYSDVARTMPMGDY